MRLASAIGRHPSISAWVMPECWRVGTCLALRGRIGDMQERCRRIEARARKKRELVCSVMERADLKKVMEPDLTVSLRPARPPLAVVDEELVPEAFWRPQLPKLDRQGLIAALAAGRDVPGAILGNAPMTISVRTK